MNSLEKLNQLVEKAQSTTPETEEQELISQAIMVGLPMIAPLVPQDPAELDELLLKLAGFALGARSDGCSPAVGLAVEEPVPAPAGEGA